MDCIGIDTYERTYNQNGKWFVASVVRRRSEYEVNPNILLVPSISVLSLLLF
jgi:hypothetical protein